MNLISPKYSNQKSPYKFFSNDLFLSSRKPTIFFFLLAKIQLKPEIPTTKIFLVHQKPEQHIAPKKLLFVQ